MAAALAIGALGTLVGSFLNVVIYRVPRGRSVVSPPSACGSCGHPVRPYDNIPLVSWLLLRGRCRDCAAPISTRYPLVELGVAVFFGVTAWRFTGNLLGAGTGGEFAAELLQLVAYLYFAAVSVALALIDLDVRRLPNAIVLPSYFVVGALFVAAAVVTGDVARLATALIGAAALGGLYLFLALVRPGAMGMGDVKLAGLIGLVLGWLGTPELLVGAFAGVGLGGVFAVGLLLAGRGRRTAMPYGPWLLAGAWVGILAGAPIASAYLGLFGITTQ
jgi:leader peptidase (prepilin peptidase)/N-methyltransferase